MNIFEFLENEKTINETTNSSLPLFKEIAIDFETGEIIEENGEIKILTGKEALNVWVWKALKTERNKYKSYSSSFGSELHKEIGYVYDRNIKEQLIISEIIDCLSVNPYVTNVYDFKVKYREDDIMLYINFSVDSIYGTIKEVQEFGV